MTGPSIAKDFHKLMKRIGRLTDGQASIDDVDWEDGNLNSLTVIIRPNASFYKGGRFKFTIHIPATYTSGDAPSVWCDTDIYHPNIDRHEEKYSAENSNVCLNILENWNQSYGLEGVVLGILFLMHHPNVDDPLSPEFDGEYPSIEQFAQNVKAYMSGETVDDNTYSIDFRVIDGVFQDLTLIKNNVEDMADHDGTPRTECKEGTSADEATHVQSVLTDKVDPFSSTTNAESAPTREEDVTILSQSPTAMTIATCETQCITVEMNNIRNSIEINKIDDTSLNNKGTSLNKIKEIINATGSDDEEDVIPVRFICDAENRDFFVLQFGTSFEQTEEKSIVCDNTAEGNVMPNAVELAELNSETSTTTYDETDCNYKIQLVENHELSKSISNLSELQHGRVLSRSVSVSRDFHVKPLNKHNPTENNVEPRVTTLARVALDCILIVYRNML